MKQRWENFYETQNMETDTENRNRRCSCRGCIKWRISARDCKKCRSGRYKYFNCSDRKLDRQREGKSRTADPGGRARKLDGAERRNRGKYCSGSGNSRGEPDVTEEQSNFEHENINYEYADKDQERKGEYEYVEELASGKTVQQENEEQEETGAGPQEGETAGGEDIEEAECEQLAYAEPSEGKIPNIAPEETPIPEETPVPAAVQQGLTLITYISEYFSPEISEIPGDISVTPITIKNQKGKSIEIIKLEYKINTENMPEETLSLRIPLTLREEYRYPAEASSYSLVQDEPLKKDRNSAGTFLLMEKMRRHKSWQKEFHHLWMWKQHRRT